MSRRRTDLVPGAKVGAWTILEELPQRGQGQLTIRWFRVQCPKGHPPVTHALSNITSASRYKGCRRCVDDTRRRITLVLPDGSLTGYHRLAQQYRRVTLVISELRDAERADPAKRRRTRAPQFRRRGDETIKEQARAMLEAGRSEGEIIDDLGLDSVDQLRALLRA